MIDFSLNPSPDPLADLLDSAESCSESEQHLLDVKIAGAANPVTKGQSQTQLAAIFTGHENVGVAERASVPLHGQNNANTGIIHEKPIHRSMAYMMAQGMSQREIAAKCEYSEGQVSQICRQQWFRDMVTAEIDSAGRDELNTLLNGTAVDSVYRLIDLRDNAKAESVQFNSAKELLDRVMGKAPQHIVQDVKLTSSDPAEEMARLQQELANLTPKVASKN